MINFKTFTHKGEVLVTISESIERLVFTPAEAETMANALLAAAKQARTEVESQPNKGRTQ